MIVDKITFKLGITRCLNQVISPLIFPILLPI